jgi:hypothetical protein
MMRVQRRTFHPSLPLNVSGARRHLKIREHFSEYAKFTVTSTAKSFRLGAIDGDR